MVSKLASPPSSTSKTASAANQGIERIAAILRVLGKRHATGARLTDVAVDTGLSKSTVHRLLSGLMQVGFVEQDAGTGHFFLSFEMFSLGSAAVNRNGLVELAHASIISLSSRTEDTVTLYIRSGNEAVCAFREEGSFPVKVMTLAAGDRRPLGIGSGPLALLAFLPDDEVDAIIEANAPKLVGYPNCSGPVLHELVELTRRRGYAFTEGVIFQDIFGVAVPIRGRDSKPIASLSVATIARRMQAERRTSIVHWLTVEAAKLEEKIATMTAGLSEPGLQRFKSVRGNHPVPPAPAG